jgi:two-component system OmpR family response regulator
LKILWIEDEERLLDEGAAYLVRERYDVVKAGCYQEALRNLENESFDLMILDWMLPDKQGIDICKEVQSKWDIPVIMVTAKTDEFDKVLALEIGADDFITKPFGMRELLARIKVVTRRINKNIWRSNDDSLLEKPIMRGELEINPVRHEVRRNREVISLTPTEFMILLTLARNPGRVFSRLQLLDASVGDAFMGYERTVDSHIRNLRRKIESDTTRPRYIISVYGIGYKFGDVV